MLLVPLTAWAALLVLPVIAAVVLLFRRFAAVVAERRSVEQVYDFARRVESLSPDDAGTRELVVAVRELLNAERVALWLPPYLDQEPRLVVDAEDGAAWYDGPGDPDDLVRRRAVDAGRPGRCCLRRPADAAEAAALQRRGAQEVLGAPVATAAGEPGYLEICDRRNDPSSFADDERAALDSMLTHVNAAIRQQQLLTQIRYDADHDRLTGLPNRQRLVAEIDELLAADPAGTRAGLILASLDNHTEIIDTLGHAASDELLLVTAGLLREHAPPQARAGPDGGRAVRRPAARAVAGRDRAGRPAAARGDLHPRPGRRARPRGLDHHRRRRRPGARHRLRHADAAGRRRAAGRGRRSAGRQLPPGARPAEPAPPAAGHRVGAGDGRGQISVVFQPIIDARSSDIVSVETLVRWAHPRYGAVAPDEFIHLAEQIGRIGPLTDHVLDLALARCRKWLDQDISLSVAVNLSARCLTEPDLVERVARALRRHGVPGELLTLELTEGSVVDDSVRSSTVLADLHALGLRLSMDDFGTGYSSLSQLRQLPIDEVKIDKSFVLGHVHQPGRVVHRPLDHRAGPQPGTAVVAEGVEDELTRNAAGRDGLRQAAGLPGQPPLPTTGWRAGCWPAPACASAAPGATHRRLFVRA